MKEERDLPSWITDMLQRRLGDEFEAYQIPPPVFTTMQGEFLAYDAENGVLEIRFPVLEAYLNPYGSLQGGMVAAAVDNTLGPLSMLVAPPNVTRRLQMKYSRPVTTDLEFLMVRGRFLGRQGQRLKFSADVRAPDGTLLARAQALHWIVEQE